MPPAPAIARPRRSMATAVDARENDRPGAGVPATPSTSQRAGFNAPAAAGSAQTPPARRRRCRGIAAALPGPPANRRWPAERLQQRLIHHRVALGDPEETNAVERPTCPGPMAHLTQRPGHLRARFSRDYASGRSARAPRKARGETRWLYPDARRRQPSRVVVTKRRFAVPSSRAMR
jgi:hypothetical protein